MPEQELLDATIKVAEIKDRTWKDKDGVEQPAWDIIDGNGVRYGLVRKALRECFEVGKSVPIKYSKKGEYTNIQQVVGFEPKGKGAYGGNRFTFEQEMEKQRIIAAQCVFKTFKEKGEWTLTPDETMIWIMGKKPQIPATKPQEVSPPISTKDKPAVAAAQGVPISQLPVEQILSELWPHLWKTHKITKSKVAELKGWMTNALKDSGFPVPENIEKAKPEQIYAMGEYARREVRGKSERD